MLFAEKNGVVEMLCVKCNDLHKQYENDIKIVMYMM
jgi:hypothetical protein